MTSFVYLVEGEPHVGDVKAYADACEEAVYSGLTVDGTVWTFTEDGVPTATRAKLSSSPYDENDYSYLTVELEFVKDDPEVAVRRIDGRA